MLLINEKVRTRIVKAFLWINGVFILFWWPLSHWFCPEAYHQFLGFKVGSCPDSLVKVIGTCGAFAVLLCFLAARNPIRNRDIVISIIIFAFLISLTYGYLIIKGDFPVREVINIFLSLFTAAVLLIVYPWGIELEKAK